KTLNIKISQDNARVDVCNKIKETMLNLEKYAKGKDKKTYVMIPENHTVYPFPYNLEDRVDYVIDKLKNFIRVKLNVKTKSKDNKYTIIIEDNKNLEEYRDILKKNGAIKEKGEWIIYIE